MAKKKNIVKKTKGTMNFILIAALAVGWLLAVMTVLSDDDVAEQNAMIASARNLLEDKLYVRAAAQYREALLSYQTENNAVYEAELLGIYKDGGMTTEYYSLIDSRIAGGKASPEEYLERVQNYLDRGSNARAVNLLKQGLEVYEDEQLAELYDSLRYECSQVSTNFTQVSMPASDWYIPVYDGEHWGYAGQNGRISLNCIYEEALPFSGSYAVVRLDGVYTLIDKNGYWNAVDKNGLDAVTALAGTNLVGVKDGKYGIYTNTFRKQGEETYDNVCLSDNGLILVQKGGKWALLDSDLKPLTDYLFTDVAVNSRGQAFASGYAVVADEKGYFLINSAGQACFETRFADARGIEGGFYAVKDNGGKWGFADEKGQIVVECRFADAHSFSDGLAAVEYAGKWGYVTVKGTMAVEARYEQAYPFLQGSALVVDEPGRYRILTLKYYSLQ